MTYPKHQPRQIIQSFESKALKKRTFIMRVADWCTLRFGTLQFLVLHLLLLVIWIVANLGLIPGVTPFDRYPFILLTMIASFEAIILTIIVLISHNRAGKTSIRRDELSLAMDLITEQELTMALRLLSEINKIHDGKLHRDPKLTQMLKDTDVGSLQQTLEKQLDNQKSEHNKE